MKLVLLLAVAVILGVLEVDIITAQPEADDCIALAEAGDQCLAKKFNCVNVDDEI